MNTDVLIVTHEPDAKWLEYLLRSLVKYARGFRNTIVVFPGQQAAAFMELQQKFKNVVWRPFNERPGLGHMHHNIIKCRADEVSDADYFLHIDSDCVLMGPIKPEDFFTNGHPDILFSKFSEIKSPWQQVVQRALGVFVEVETMRRHPFLYPRWLYEAMRSHVARVNGMPFDDFVFTAPCSGGAHRGFTEFCTLGAYARHFHAEKFHFYDTNTSSKPCDVRQYWSFSGITEQERYELEGYTRDWDKPQIFDK